jgi:phage-related protein
MAEKKNESMMERAQQFLAQLPVMIRVKDILAGANIRQIRPQGVEKLFKKIKRNGFLPVRGCLHNTTIYTQFYLIVSRRLYIIWLHAYQSMVVNFFIVVHQSTIILYKEDQKFYCVDGMHRISALVKCIDCTEPWAISV